MAESNQPIATPPRETARRLQLAYLAVLGADGARNADQQIVWRDVESFCHAYRMLTEQTRELRLDNTATYINEGRRSFWLRARGQIRLALAEPRKPGTSRKNKP